MATTRPNPATCEESVPLVAPLAEQKHAAHRSYAKVIAGGALATLGAFACFANPRPTVNLNAAGARLGASSGEFTLHTGCSPLNKLSYGFSGAGTVGARIVSKSMSNDFRFEQAVEMKEVSCGNYAISDFSLEEGEEFGFYLYPIGDTSDENTVLDDGCLHEGDARCPAFASPATLVGGECTVKYTDPGSDDVFYNRVYDGSTTAYTWGSCEATCAVGQPDGCPAATGAFSTAVALNDNGSATTADIGEASFNEKFAACPVVKYVRNGVDYAFYTRTSDIPSDFNAYSIFTYTWANSDNVLGTDFEIYSSLDDLKSGSNKWSFCNYNDPDVGFPRDCGPNGYIANTWFSFPGGKYNARGLTSGSGFELWDGSDCPVTKPEPSPFSTAVALNDNGSATTADIGEASFNEKFAACPVVKYVRNGVDYAFYTRTSDIPSDFNAYSIFTYTWANSDNVLGTDFEIYSSLDDLKSGSNKWSFCNYNDPDVGFPRDCGPNGYIANTWFSFPGGKYNARGLTSGSGFELWDGSDCPSTATLSPSPSPPPPPLEEQCPISTSTGDAGYVDAYRGWYDASGCGICQDYCRWVGNSGAGGDPSKKTTHGSSWWSCRAAKGTSTYTGKTEYGSTFGFAKCSGQGATPP